MQRMILIFLLSVCLKPALSQWSTDPAENNILSWYTQNPLICSDLDNGIIMVAQSYPYIYRPVYIFTQRISADGYRLWPGNSGVPVSDSVGLQWLGYMGYEAIEEEFFLSDGAGGCYVGFQMARLVEWINDSDYYDITVFIQRLDANGNRLFGPNGFQLMPDGPDSSKYQQHLRSWFPDGRNGLYVVWERIGRNGFNQSGQYMARISDKGEYIWGPKRVPYGSYIPFLDANLNLNIYFYWGETSPPGKFPDKFIRYDPETGTIISEKEIEIGTGEYGFNFNYDYCLSDNHSAIFAFHDFRGDTLRMQKLDQDGNILWGEKPVVVGNSLYGPSLFTLKSDLNGGAYIVYRAKNDSFHLVHINHGGERLWKRSFQTDGSQSTDNISVGGQGDVFVLMEKIKYLYKINFQGELQWKTQVTCRDTIAAYTSWPRLKADRIGGCTVLWWEKGGGFIGIRAQRVNRAGNLGGPLPVHVPAATKYPNKIEIDSIYPNPFNSSTLIQFSLPNPKNVNLKIYNILGKEVKTLVAGELQAGEYSIHWQGDDKYNQLVASGVYFVRVQHQNQIQIQKILKIH